jgi:hypothetical protein
LIEEAKEAIKKEEPKERLEDLAKQLMNTLSKLGTYSSTSSAKGTGESSGPSSSSEEDVIDADFNES